MIKKGDTVAPILQMSKEGVVVKLFESKSNAWFVGGASSKRLVIQVFHEKTGEYINYPYADLVKVD